MMAYENIWRILSSQDLTVGSSGGVATSTAAFGAQTYAIQVAFSAVETSTSGIYIAIGEAPVAASTTGTLITPNVPFQFKVTPGQKISGVSKDAVISGLNVTQLTK